MSIQQKPFTRYNEEKKIDSFSVRLNEEERNRLNEAKRLILQPKDSTALKSLAWFGAYVLQRPETSYLLNTLFKNERNNKRLGIEQIE